MLILELVGIITSTENTTVSTCSLEYWITIVRILTCVLGHLGSFSVAWVSAEKKDASLGFSIASALDSEFRSALLTAQSFEFGVWSKNPTGVAYHSCV